MSNLQYKNQKKPLTRSKKEIDRAGSAIRHCANGSDRLNAIKAIQGFREFHLYPLMLIKNHLVRTSDKLRGKKNVARRLKRLDTIIDKLERATLDGENVNQIKLTRMQDIAGCRAIVEDLDMLKELQRRLEKSRSVHKIVAIKDYLTPKKSGYGGVHLIYSCYEKSLNDHDWKKAKVEVQLRTELQHAWATSLEIIDTLERINLKTSHVGHEDWREFFSLAGKLVAHKEGACIIKDDLELEELRLRLGFLVIKLDVVTKLTKYSLAIRVIEINEIKKTFKSSHGMFLLKVYMRTEEGDFDESGMEVVIEHFKMKDSSIGLQKLNQADLDPKVDISIFVEASSINSLKQAYPNYFGSTYDFCNFLNEQCNKIIDLSN